MAALHRAIPLEQIDGVAVMIAKNLDFDVARLASGIFPVRRARRRKPRASRRQEVSAAIEIIGALHRSACLCRRRRR
jgi:hypothetical protein